MINIILLKGLPASGKSTYAKDFIKSQTPNSWKRINKDSLRDMLDSSVYSKGNEKMVLQIRDDIFRIALLEGKHIIIDDTNFEPKHEKRLREIVEETLPREKQYKFEVKYFDVSLEECICRDKTRANSVGEKVITTMYNKYIKQRQEIEYKELNHNLPRAIICDLDGTLALLNGRDPYDANGCEEDGINPAVSVILEQYPGNIIFVSGREDKYRKQTERWLDEYGYGFNAVTRKNVFMRKTGDYRKDSIVKKEIYDRYIKANYAVEFVLDDRDCVVKMWREKLGLRCLQVAPGDF